jgi:hypothetical protein
MSARSTCEIIPKLIKNPFGNDNENPGITEISSTSPAPIPTLVLAYPPRGPEIKLDNTPITPIQTVIESKTVTVEQTRISQALQSLFQNGGFGLQFFTVETDMLPAQWIKYQTEINAETNYDQTTAQSLDIETDPSINFLYPGNIYNLFPIDAIAPNGGWVTKRTLAELGAFSPKFNFLITFIQQRADKRHYINSTFLERYGVDLLVALLTAAGFVPLVATFAHRDSGGRLLGNKSLQHREIMRTFNSNRRFNILISNMSGLDESLIDVDYVHFVENLKYERFIKIINRVYRNTNYSVRKPLKIVYHIANGPNSERASDYQYLQKFVSILNENIQTGVRLQ